MKMFKMFFVSTTMMGTLLSISSYSWFSMWAGLEINLLSIIPLFSSKNKALSSEASIKYFITQAMASAILLMSIMLELTSEEFINPLMNSIPSILMSSALLTKIGAAPFHYWFPEVMEGLNWNSAWMLLTWQKIAPMVILMNSNLNFNLILFSAISSMIISSFLSMNQISMRKIMAFSSINHIAWMILSITMSSYIWMMYLTVYTILNTNLILMFKYFKILLINQMNLILNENKITKMIFLSNFLSLGGLPPFLGFLPKWLVINWMTLNNMMFIAIIAIISSLILLYVYLRVAMTSLLLSNTETKIFKLNPSKNIMITMISIPTLTFCSLIPLT